eukprot:m.189764 g.189764  ORF g.189764 m.189764 type:complete len:615 (+) comp17820_c0_seq1:269-2113(+)
MTTIAAAATEAPSPFHPGELAVQRREGVADEIAPWASKVVRPFMPDQHRTFYQQLPFVVASTRDPRDGQPWATLLAGPSGFITSPNDTVLSFARRPDTQDPAGRGMAINGADVGILGIELHTRRRNRLAARVRLEDGHPGFHLDVEQAFGNCPQHIRERNWRWRPQQQADDNGETDDTDVTPTATVTDSNRLTPDQQRWIDGADTFFIATGYRGRGENRAYGMDASHRGGEPGFVLAPNDTTIRFGDFGGNNHFNTLGNLELDDRVGVTFVDFGTGSLLHITGHAHVLYDRAAAAATFHNAQRIVTITVLRVVERRQVLPLVWDATPAGRELTVGRIEQESEDVKSFYLVPRDGAALVTFQAGQYLPITVNLEGTRDAASAGSAIAPTPTAPVGNITTIAAATVERTYSLSGPPGVPFYRLSVKREPRGVVSRYLHDHIRVGSTIRAGAPKGEFVVPASSLPSASGASERPLVLVGGGIGITPFVAMAYALAGSSRRVIVVHGVRDNTHRPCGDELDALASAVPNLEMYTRYSRQMPVRNTNRNTGQSECDTERCDATAPVARGRIDASMLVELAGTTHADFMVCGPSAFMADLRGGLEAAGVSPAHLHEESFG